MEKFGIFELLDALSALTAQEFPSEGQSEASSPQETPSPSVHDAAFSAPVYGGFSPDANHTAKPADQPHVETTSAAGNFAASKNSAAPQQPENANPPQGDSQKTSLETDALKGFYARHNAVAKRATGKK